MLGHNGEINTIARLRAEARMLGVPIRDDSSDSQDLNRLIETLIHRRGLSLPEAMELAVPPIVNEIRQFPEDLRGFYMYLRQAMGPFAQGPIALIARHGDEYVFSRRRARPAPAVADRGARRLRVQLRARRRAARRHDRRAEAALARREGDGARSSATSSARLLDHQEMQRLVHKRWLERTGADAVAGFEQAIPTGGPLEGPEIPGYTRAGPSEPVKVEERVLAGMGWQREDTKLVQQMASNGAEPIGSLGYDGPLAALSAERQNLADYFKETVAVVTNPAIDREREIEHFSCRAVFGAAALDRRGPDDAAHDRDRVPDHPRRPPRHGAAVRRGLPRASPRSTRPTCSRTCGSASAGARRVLDISCLEAETIEGALERLKYEAAKKVLDGAELLVLSRPHRVRGRAAVARPAPRAGGDRPRAARVPRRAGRGEPAPAHLASCCARARSATCTTSAWRSAWAPTASART